MGKAGGQEPLKLNKSKFILLTDVDYIKAKKELFFPPFLQLISPRFLYIKDITYLNQHNPTCNNFQIG